VTPPTWLYFPATAAAPFAPGDIASLRAWYKADAIAGLSNNDAVSTWADSSASAYDISSSGSDRPTYITNAQNSLPVVRFANKNLDSGNVALFNNVAGLFIIAVRNITTAPSSGRSDIIGMTFASDSTRYRALLTVGATANKSTSGGRRVGSESSFTGAVSSANFATGSFALQAVRIDYTSGNVAQFIDGTQDGSATIGTTGNSESTNTAAIKMGRFDVSFAALTGDVAEVIVCDAALSTGDRQKLEGYLAHKWGLTGNLPAGHPYLSAPPTNP
jgi:hypothetical protein